MLEVCHGGLNVQCAGDSIREDLSDLRGVGAGEGGSQVVADLESHERVRNADREASSLTEASATAAKFSWNDRGKQGLDAPIIAAALPQAIWVSSVTESGLDDLRSAVLRMLQEQNKQEPGYPEGV